ncbi:MAG TPA: FCD domain-containing protein [Acetobacteraceae bacterium]|nr:FCD domain-containing protein [Acetobacteraceae bacterium]
MAPDATQHLRVGDKAERIVAALRERLAADRRLPPERVLAEQLGVTRHQVRRSIAALRDGGELDAAARPRGARPVRDEALVRSTNPIEVIELRLALEPALARLAALRASPADIVRIQRAATTWSGTAPGDADLAFHNAVAASARNALAEAFYALLRRIGTDTRVALQPDRPLCARRIQQRDSEHRAIADAIAARDPQAAEQAMRMHLAAVQMQVMERLAPGATAA